MVTAYDSKTAMKEEQGIAWEMVLRKQGTEKLRSRSSLAKPGEFPRAGFF